MDKSTRNNIQRATQRARKLLEDAYREQLEGTFDILLDGTVAPHSGTHLSAAQRVTREKLVATIAHKRSSGLNATEAVDAYLREAAFTTLNRFVALKMLEARDLVQECVSKGEDSLGFKEFTALAPGLVSIEDKGYRLYLESLFDEIGQEVNVLFDRGDVASLLWPERQTLLELLGILNDTELTSIWAEDETIGWVYQYFNGNDERTQMRAESQAPRNSRELAVRNQFFTPRYVVQFLADNTLGRTWFEMMQGNTALSQRNYLVRRPQEVFLEEGEQAPELSADEVELSQEDLLQQPVYVPFRAKKDPRDLRVLDPACGSGHFLLYAFDLLITLYEEAWADPGAAVFTQTGETLRTAYDSRDGLRRAIPELVLRHNLYGVDIDPRAAQIAALALWMRAQRAYNQFDVPRAERPPIRRTNIVVAEPVPGNEELLEEFASDLRPAVLGGLFLALADEMSLAGEAGALLQVERAIADAIAAAERQFEQGDLFAQQPGAGFWDAAESGLLDALHQFSSSTMGVDSVRRTLFAEDAAAGVAFLDVVRGLYDVVLMNPPFGEYSLGAKDYCKTRYAASSGDIFQAFVDRASQLLTDGGRIGVLSARTGFFMGNSEAWRKTVAWSNHLELFADLGLGVLDEALVEAAAYVLTTNGGVGVSAQTIASRHLSARDKESSLQGAVQFLRRPVAGTGAEVFTPPLDVIRRLPSAVFAYWAPAVFLRRFINEQSFEGVVGRVRQGLATADDFRFARLRWEVATDSIGPDKRWHPFSKGGAYAPPFDDIHLVVDWDDDGRSLRSRSASRVQNDAFYHQPGITYTVRTGSDFAAKVLPGDCIFSHNAQSWFLGDQAMLLASAAYFQTRVAKAFVELAVGGGDVSASASAARRYTTAVVQSIPASSIPALAEKVASGQVQPLLKARAIPLVLDETSALFGGLPIDGASSLGEVSMRQQALLQTSITEALGASAEIDRFVSDHMRLSESERDFVRDEAGPHPWSYQKGVVESSEIVRHLRMTTEQLVAAAVEARGAYRWTTKKAYQVDRRTELVCHSTGCHPDDVLQAVSRTEWEADSSVLDSVVSFIVGIAFGRWSWSAATGAAEAFAHNPFRPEVAVGTMACVGSDTSLLVHDEGHRADFGRVLAGVCNAPGEQGATLLEDIVMSMGGSAGLRAYLAKEFFARHISMYSKSRRKAPVYWQLATPSGAYSVWIYYHQLSRDTIFRTANDFVAPKVDHEERKLDALRREAGPDPSSKHRRSIDAQEALVADLRALLTEVRRVAPLWNPDLNDGVLINFAPLWRLVPQNKSWQKECKRVWDKLVKGDYDWAHLAMHLWPERVVPKCAKDRSFAICHGLEQAFWYETDSGKWKARKVDREQLDELIEERSSTAVKAALDSLLNAPAPSGGSKRRGRNRGGA